MKVNIRISKSVETNQGDRAFSTNLAAALAVLLSENNCLNRDPGLVVSQSNGQWPYRLLPSPFAPGTDIGTLFLVNTNGKLVPFAINKLTTQLLISSNQEAGFPVFQENSVTANNPKLRTNVVMSTPIEVVDEDPFVLGQDAEDVLLTKVDGGIAPNNTIYRTAPVNDTHVFTSDEEIVIQNVYVPTHNVARRPGVGHKILYDWGSLIKGYDVVGSATVTLQQIFTIEFDETLALDQEAALYAFTNYARERSVAEEEYLWGAIDLEQTVQSMRGVAGEAELIRVAPKITDFSPNSETPFGVRIDNLANGCRVAFWTRESMPLVAGVVIGGDSEEVVTVTMSAASIGASLNDMLFTRS